MCPFLCLTMHYLYIDKQQSTLRMRMKMLSTLTSL